MTSNPSKTLSASGEEPATIRCSLLHRLTIFSPQSVHCHEALEICRCSHVVVMRVVLHNGRADTANHAVAFRSGQHTETRVNLVGDLRRGADLRNAAAGVAPTLTAVAASHRSGRRT